MSCEEEDESIQESTRQLHCVGSPVAAVQTSNSTLNSPKKLPMLFKEKVMLKPTIKEGVTRAIRYRNGLPDRLTHRRVLSDKWHSRDPTLESYAEESTTLRNREGRGKKYIHRIEELTLVVPLRRTKVEFTHRDPSAVFEENNS